MDWVLLANAASIGLGTVFWMWYLTWEVNQRRKEQEKKDDHL